MSAKRKAIKQVLNIKEEVVEADDPRIHVCRFCKRPGILLTGYNGYGFYTLAKHGKKYKTTKTVNHHASKAEWALKCKEAQYAEMKKNKEKRIKKLELEREKKKKEAEKAAKAKAKEKKTPKKEDKKEPKKAKKKVVKKAKKGLINL